ncbi:catalase [Arthrobacter roseus]|uniref:catalase n=1 Tax=Arthrobacter roseus TaxID=136274 RepID=UPI001964D64F|nr:catalase [Arthrobacter roseus]MBM7847353.1 catalase [Arthrobacter roseus]
MNKSNAGKQIPGAPGSEPPTVAEPTEPREPLPPKPDQRRPKTVSPTGVPTGAPQHTKAQSGRFLTTAQGVRVNDTDHSLKAGNRGPTLLQDHHLREKIMHFDHERIPERVVHARGAAAHGVFRANGAAENITSAGFLAKGAETPVFVRFSNVVGSRGSADVVRDTRGFATKFYTDEGVYDLVGNNMPVFFIQDAIKFPDLVHAAKPHPDREIPQAQSAHDTFWDFVSLHTEAQAHLMWQMSDRGIPRSNRMMEGFGVHTFRLINHEGDTTLVKFHWKPRAGVHSVIWEEAQLINGMDPDFHRRDLADAIEAGAFPEWDLGVQTFPDTDDETFEGIDLLDPTKLIPEELAPVQLIGTMTLSANPTNYFAETEQVAFHPGHLVPGIDVTNDPLLQGRLFSYLDTQISRLGGPNFAQLPINRPHAPVNDMLRDGMHQTAVHSGVAPYKPNSLDGGCPFMAGADAGAFIDVPERIPESMKLRENPASFEDHLSQARLFFRSLTSTEQDHTIQAFSFELGKCYEQAIRERQVQILVNIDERLGAEVATSLGLSAPKRTEDVPDRATSPALSQVGRKWPVASRLVGIVVGSEPDVQDVEAAKAAVEKAGMLPLIIAPTAGKLDGGKGPVVQRSYLTARSIEFDAVVIAGAPTPAPDAVLDRDAKAGDPMAVMQIDPRVTLLISESYRHAKPLGGWGEAASALQAAGVPSSAPGVVLDQSATKVIDDVAELLATHRVWERS